MKSLGYFFGFIVLFPFISFGQNATIDQYFKSIEKDVWGNFYVEKKGQILVNKSIGYENSAKKITLSENSVFKIGSITKMFTAVMILQLVEEHKLQLDQTLDLFFPTVPNAKKITIKMLLQHRSGLFNYTDNDEFINMVSKPITDAQLLIQFSNDPVIFQPDQKFSYSNTNYILLGFIIEKITQKKYGDNLKERITDKIHLTHTFYDIKADITPNHALSYVLEDGKWVETLPVWDMSWAQSAGGISATEKDLSQFIKALFQHKLINDISLEQMIKMNENYGFGIAEIPYNHEVFYGHSGGIESYLSMLAYNPKDETVLIHLSNAHHLDLNDIDIQLLNFAYKNPIELPNERTYLKLDESQLQAFCGTYSSPSFPLKIKIFIENSTLKAQADGQPSFTLSAISEDTFEFTPAKINMKFDGKSSPKKMHFNQNGYEVDFTTTIN